MAPGGLREAGISPVLSSLALVASAAILVGGFFVAQTFYEDPSQGAPEVAVWPDDAHDRLLVVSGDRDGDWQGLELRTDRPARASLVGDASLTQGTFSPGGKFVALSTTSQSIVGGDTLSICAVAKGGPMEVTLRDIATKAPVFEYTLDVKECPRGADGLPTA